MNSIPPKTPHKLKMMGESKNGKIAISKLPVAWKKPTASGRHHGLVTSHDLQVLAMRACFREGRARGVSCHDEHEFQQA